MPVKTQPDAAGDFMEVHADPAQDTITARILFKRHEIATRVWRLGDEGIEVDCVCEKKTCSERGLVYRPKDAERITAQLVGFIEDFAEEYGVQAKKIRYFHVRERRPIEETKLKVPAGWKDPAALNRAWKGFEALRISNRNNS